MDLDQLEQSILLLEDSAYTEGYPAGEIRALIRLARRNRAHERSEDEMDASPRKVEHAKATDPAASADPAADLALVKRLRDRHLITRFAIEIEAADAIERLLRERDDLKDDYLRRHKDACDRFEEVIVLKAERDAALRERDDLRAATLSKLLLPCPICNGVEGCDHTVPERLKARLAAALAKGAEDMRAAIIDDMEKAIVEIKAKQPWNETPLFLRSSVDAIRTLGARRSRPEMEDASVKVENHEV